MWCRGRAAVCWLLLLLLGGVTSVARAERTRTVAVYQNRMGAQYSLRELSYAVDGNEVAHVGPGDPRLSRAQFEVFDRDLTPGVHTLSVIIKLEGQRIAVFEYLSGFKFRVQLDFEFTAEREKRTDVAVIGYLKQGRLLRYEDRPTARFLISNPAPPPPKTPEIAKTETPIEPPAPPITAKAESPMETPKATPITAKAESPMETPKAPPMTAKVESPIVTPKPAPPPKSNKPERPIETPKAAPATNPTGAEPPVEPPIAAPPPPKIAGAELPVETPNAAPHTPTVKTEVFNPSGITSKILRFRFDSDSPRSAFRRSLDEIAQALAAHPEIHLLRIEGHTDDIGPDNYNQWLSERRARDVARRISSKGVDRARLETVGFGESRPIVPGKSHEARARNRRVEFVIVE